jgi:uncharacterized membrane protein
MSPTPHLNQRLDESLARLLKWGTWLSCALIAVGIALPLVMIHIGLARVNLVSVGIWLLITLPVLRVALMGLWFVVYRDVPFAVAAALVLCIIVLSAILGATVA